MIRVAILSYWHVHAEGYTQEFMNTPSCQVTCLWDELPERGRKMAEKFAVPYEPCLDALLAREDVDAVCVNAPTNMHPEVMVKAANAGKHIFTEKVLALTCDGARQIIDAIEKNGVQFCISFPHRTMPRNLYAKQVVDSGKLGKITLMRVRNAHDGTSGNWLPPHFYDGTQCGGGAMIDLGAHPMYLCNYLMGRPAAVTSTFTEMYGKGVEDNAVSVLEYPNGAIAISETGFVSSASPYQLEIYGTDGSLLICEDDVQLRLKGQDAQTIPLEQMPAPLPSAIAQFTAAIAGQGKAAFGTQDAYDLTELMEKAYQAHRTHSRVTF